MGISTFAYGFLDYTNRYNAPEINEVVADLEDMGLGWKHEVERNMLIETFTFQEVGTRLVDLSDETNIGWFVRGSGDVWVYSRNGKGFKVFFSSTEMLEYVVSGSKELCAYDSSPFGKIERAPQYRSPGWEFYMTEAGNEHCTELVERTIKEKVQGRECCYFSLKVKDRDLSLIVVKADDYWVYYQTYLEEGRSPRVMREFSSDMGAIGFLLQMIDQSTVYSV